MSSAVFRRFSEEITSIIGKRVEVETAEGKSYQGNLRGIDEKLDLILDDVVGAGEGTYKVVVNGSFVKEIRLVERPFDLKALADRLGRVFPGMVKIREDIGVIIVMDKIKVTESGVTVTEGSGPAADKVKAIYNEFMREKK